ncbi:MAG: hypothetical protein ACK55Z_05790, partial [bacterium]
MPRVPSRSSGARCSTTVTAALWPGWDTSRETREAASSLVLSFTTSPLVNTFSVSRVAERLVQPTSTVAASSKGLALRRVIGRSPKKYRQWSSSEQDLGSQPQS